MKEICKKDGRYNEVIKQSYIVKNAVILLGEGTIDEGRSRERKVKEGREVEGEERRRDEGGVDGIGRRRE